MPTARPRAGLTFAALASLTLVAGCERPVGCTGEYCGTMVIASGGEPDILLPPVSEFSITRDVTDQLFLKLADLGSSGNTIGDEDFQTTPGRDRKSTRLNSSHVAISYAVFCLKKKKKNKKKC